MSCKYAFPLLIVIILMSFSSCDPGVTYSRVLENNSQYDLELHIFKRKDSLSCRYSYLSDSIIVEKKSVKTMAAYSGSGQTFEFENCESCADSIVLKVIGYPALKSTVDLNEPAFWNFRVIQKTFKSGGTCECRFIMTNERIK